MMTIAAWALKHDRTQARTHAGTHEPSGEIAEGVDVGETLLASRDSVDRHRRRRSLLLCIAAREGAGINERRDGACPRRAGGVFHSGCCCNGNGDGDGDVKGNGDSKGVTTTVTVTVTVTVTTTVTATVNGNDEGKGDGKGDGEGTCNGDGICNGNGER